MGIIWSENRIPLFGIPRAKQNGAGKSRAIIVG
jgi:hypothetical protein